MNIVIIVTLHVQDKDPRKEPLWQLAEGLGATCLPAYDPAVTTHVVAAGGGTAKVRARVDHRLGR